MKNIKTELSKGNSHLNFLALKTRGWSEMDGPNEEDGPNDDILHFNLRIFQMTELILLFAEFFI